MKYLFLTLILSVSSFALGQNIANAKTVEVAIAGNCGMCEKTIETAANKKGEAALDWNKATKKAKLTYNAKKTTPKEVLKRVANAGYDNQYFSGNDKAYAGLAQCCQYSREAKMTKACCAEGHDAKSCDHSDHKDGAACCTEH